MQHPYSPRHPPQRTRPASSGRSRGTRALHRRQVPHQRRAGRIPKGDAGPPRLVLEQPLELAARGSAERRRVGLGGAFDEDGMDDD